jgi:hypothetical protein
MATTTTAEDDEWPPPKTMGMTWMPMGFFKLFRVPDFVFVFSRLFILIILLI